LDAHWVADNLIEPRIHPGKKTASGPCAPRHCWPCAGPACTMQMDGWSMHSHAWPESRMHFLHHPAATRLRGGMTFGCDGQCGVNLCTASFVRSRSLDAHIEEALCLEARAESSEEEEESSEEECHECDTTEGAALDASAKFLAAVLDGEHLGPTQLGRLLKLLVPFMQDVTRSLCEQACVSAEQTGLVGSLLATHLEATTRLLSNVNRMRAGECVSPLRRRLDRLDTSGPSKYIHAPPQPLAVIKSRTARRPRAAEGPVTRSTWWTTGSCSFVTRTAFATWLLARHDGATRCTSSLLM
jgi:hypothetical protein